MVVRRLRYRSGHMLEAIKEVTQLAKHDERNVDEALTGVFIDGGTLDQANREPDKFLKGNRP